MDYLSKHLEAAVERISSLPGIGKNTALRLAMHLYSMPQEKVDSFLESIKDLKDLTHSCAICGCISDETTCSICQDERRKTGVVCVVEGIQDLLAVEGTRQFKGRYHVLGGVISPIDGIGPDELNLSDLAERVREEDIHEVILALNSSMESDTTSFYLYKVLKDTNVTVSTLSRGVSIGADLQYADQLTLGSSLLNRVPYEVNLK